MSTTFMLGSDQESAQPSYIKDSTTQDFGADVIEASKEVPIIVDFWAPWCGPCKQLTPVLEKIVNAAAGAVRLVKINVDENQELSQSLRVQSIPAVFGFKNGQPVDGFSGALPESQIKAFIERLAGPIGPSPIEEMIEQGEAALAASDLGAAAQIFAEILGADATEPRALAGLARCYLRNGDLERAQQTLDMVPDDAKNHAAVVSVLAELNLSTSAVDAGEVAQLRADLEANPKNHQVRLDLSTALIAAGDQEAGMDELLELIRLDRKWNEEAARKQLLTLFEALGPADPLTLAGRRRLSSILFS